MTSEGTCACGVASKSELEERSVVSISVMWKVGSTTVASASLRFSELVLNSTTVYTTAVDYVLVPA